VREYISDFAVIITLLIMVCIDHFFHVETPKLHVPHTFQVGSTGTRCIPVVQPSATGEGRDNWLVSPFVNVWWTWLAAAGPALLATILYFLEHQVSRVE
jgi:hypothetical protein